MIKTLSDVKLKSYQRFKQLGEDVTDEDAVICLADISRGDLYKMNPEDVEELGVNITEMFSETQHSFKTTFKLHGVEYGFIPDLEAISYGENKDLVSYINDWQTMHKAMAVGYRPITNKIKGKYLIEDYEGTSATSEIMRDAPLDIVLGMYVFFYNLTNALAKHTLNYTVVQMMDLSQQFSLKNGEAIKSYIHFLKGIYDDSMKSQNKDYIRA